MSKRIIPIFFLIIIKGINPLFCQVTKKHEGSARIGGTEGTANYSYYISKNDTIFHGPFKFQRSVQEDGESMAFKIFSIEGNFKRNVADGLWQLRKGRFNPVGKGELRDYAFVFDIEGSEFFLSGAFKNGEANGHWQIFEWTIANSGLKDTLLSATLPFKNSLPSGAFVFQKDAQTFKGNINEKGLAQDKWVFNAVGPKEDQVTEEWIFKDNQLVRKIIYRNNKTLTIDIEDPVTEFTPQIVEMEMTESYFNLIDIKAALNEGHDFHFFQKETMSQNLYLDVIEKLSSSGDYFASIARKDLNPNIKARIEKFPYSEQELVYLDGTSVNFAEADSIVENIQGDAQINLAKLSNPEIASYLSTLNEIRSRYLLPIDSVLHIFETGSLVYLNRNKLISRAMKPYKNKGNPVAFNSGKATINYHLQKLDSIPKETTGQLYGFSVKLLSEIHEINDSLQMFLHEIKREKKLVAMEEALMAKYERIKLLNDSLITGEHRIIAGFDIQSALIGFVEEQLNNYSNLPSADKKSGQIEPLLECLKNMEKLIFSIERVPENNRMVEQAYSQQVFNPYTYTYMEIKVKEPIYKAYKNILLPSLLKNLQDMKCEKIAASSENFQILFGGMIDLLNKDTRKTERKIRRVTDPQKAAGLINLNLTF